VENRGRTVPSDAELKALALDSLMTFNKGLQAKSFADFHKSISIVWKKQISPEQLAEAFRTFVEKELDLTPIQNLTPAFEAPPSVNSDGVLILVGFVDADRIRQRHLIQFAEIVNHLAAFKVEARIERRSKLPGILFDRMLLFIEAAASWAHGRRPEKIAPCPSASGATESTPGGRIDGLKKEQREAFIAFIELLYRQATGKQVPQNDMEKAGQHVRELILDHLRRFTMERKTAES
jgi:hypothetical protein